MKPGDIVRVDPKAKVPRTRGHTYRVTAANEQDVVTVRELHHGQALGPLRSFHAHDLILVEEVEAS